MSPRLYFILILALVSVSSTSLIVRVLPSVPALTMAFWRMLIASALLWSYSLFKRPKPLNKKNFNIISIFAGRIADTGRDPKFIISKCVKYKKNKNIKILWASTREYLNIIQAQNEKCDIITVTPEILSKKKLSGYNLEKFSIDTSKAFYEDAKKMKLKI